MAAATVTSVTSALDFVRAEWPPPAPSRHRLILPPDEAANAHTLQEHCDVAAEMFAGRVAPPYREAALSEVPDPQRAALVAWLTNPDPTLFIHGPGPGSGKTYAAHAVAAELAQTIGLWPTIFTEADFLCASPRRATVRHNNIERLTKFALVLVDDVGVSRLTASQLARLAQLEAMMDRRVAGGRRTIIVSALSPAELMAQRPRHASHLLATATTAEFPASMPDLRLHPPVPAVGPGRHRRPV